MLCFAILRVVVQYYQHQLCHLYFCIPHVICIFHVIFLPHVICVSHVTCVPHVTCIVHMICLFHVIFSLTLSASLTWLASLTWSVCLTWLFRLNEFDTELLAQEDELPSDEEELAVQLKHAYQDQIALDEKAEIKRLKERFVQVSTKTSTLSKYLWFLVV